MANTIVTRAAAPRVDRVLHSMHARMEPAIAAPPQRLKRRDRGDRRVAAESVPLVYSASQ
ncbi:hypothetical protein [Burkholderia latens]|uniref:hypothetical protein n=1 Tax=Burkholderia latens TaxID=488446 RepID=UPI00158E3EA7|nr:hypothetical protein [Burkholderia latens]